MTKSENHNKEYDWVAIQNFYNLGNSYRDIQKTFGCCNATIARSVKRGRLITRSRLEALKLQRKNSPARKHSQETKEKISEIRKAFLKENPDKVPYRLNHSSRESYPEKIFREAYASVVRRKYPERCPGFSKKVHVGLFVRIWRYLFAR